MTWRRSLWLPGGRGHVEMVDALADVGALYLGLS